MKKNILLTIWLLLPITIVSLLMVWIFVSLDKERLMADAVPIGAGAGDTGNANALGQWLAGRDADAVSDALEARRAGLAIDPRDWPGGVEFRIKIQESFPEVTRLTMTVLNDQPGRLTSSALVLEDGVYTKLFLPDRLQGSYFVICESLPTRTENGFVDQSGKVLSVMHIRAQIPGADLQAADPMIVEHEMDSIYE